MAQLFNSKQYLFAQPYTLMHVRCTALSTTRSNADYLSHHHVPLNTTYAFLLMAGGQQNHLGYCLVNCRSHCIVHAAKSFSTRQSALDDQVA
jgi:hypothetical protein